MTRWQFIIVVAYRLAKHESLSAMTERRFVDSVQQLEHDVLSLEEVTEDAK